ncbi:unnamed protein product [Rotaria magnacalcarata]|uniref:polynucleotide adenylyltransferase n=8 Tax=Rotaria magnacalcarata TaxID=392030 RepID=A0A814TDF3_9BILA|nr:unnamed protein product [Rotaria magnacalcarata]CAF2260771.1 unnamed protein product [Rotaria magnacalcarata]
MTESNSEIALTEQLNLIRSILQSEELLQIQSSGDYDQVRIKLDHDIQITFFFDSLSMFNKPLTIETVHDLRLTKSSSKCLLTNEQWITIRQYFDELIQQSDNTTLIQSIVQSIQDHLLQILASNKTTKQKGKKPPKTTTSDKDSSSTTNRFRGGELIFNRILHDKTIDRSKVIIGYEDRFTGIHEIAFNEFKKVHEHEYGVPMHRLRHFKINGEVVWDRTNKIDILTGNKNITNSHNLIKDDLHLAQGLFYFDQSTQQWIQYPHIPIISDDQKNPSTIETCLPSRCHFVTWNILVDYHHSQLIYTSQRYQSILDKLKSLLPDVICLQEVTKTFINLLLNQIWLQENHYYIVFMEKALDSEQTKSYGQLLLTKNFRPRSFSICPLDTTEKAADVTKQIIIARFGLNPKITIDLVNLHLNSNGSRNAERKRCQTLEHLLQNLKTNNFMLIGDFNFGDFDLKENDLLDKYQEEVHDLWKQIYNIDENPGYTFDPSRNICAQIMSDSQINRRFDRYLLHKLNNVYYSIEHLQLVGTETIPIDESNEKQINLSDHYALQLIIDFQTRIINHRSALVILPPTNHWPMIKSFCDGDGPSFVQWPPHFNLLWPFYYLNHSLDDQLDILLPLRILFSQISSFQIQVDDFDTFMENHVSFLKPNEKSTQLMKELFERTKRLLPACVKNPQNEYNPHLTIEQYENAEQLNQARSSLVLHKPFDFPVEYVYILQRCLKDDAQPFHILYQIPLGPVLPKLNSIDLKLKEFFQTMNLYESDESYNQKQDKFTKLSSCFQQIFNEQNSHHFRHSFVPYGSFRIGINGEDLDTVFVLNEVKSNEGETELDKTLIQMQHDKSSLNNHILNLLETQIKVNFENEIVYCRKVQALFSIISILFTDLTKVDVSLQIKLNEKQSLESSKEPTLGVHEIEHLLIHARSPPIFQHLLTFIRKWAQNFGIYGQVYGYLGGYSWAILCAHICHSFLTPIESLYTIEQFSVDQLFSLVQSFFSTYSKFNWSTQTLTLVPRLSKSMNNSSTVLQRGSMRILSPTPPHNNSARATIASTRDLIVQYFQRIENLLETINTISSEDKFNALKRILELKVNFPIEKIQTIIECTLSTDNSNELDEWIGWMKSRLAYFMNDCETKCNLFVQTNNSIEYRSSKNEGVYSIGFEVDEERLKTNRSFSHCLNRFLDQCNLYSNRRESMKISHKLISIHDWKLEQMLRNPQRLKN